MKRDGSRFKAPTKKRSQQLLLFMLISFICWLPKAEAKRYIVKLTGENALTGFSKQTGRMKSQPTVRFQSQLPDALRSKVSIVKVMSGNAMVIEMAENKAVFSALLQRKNIAYIEEDKRAYPSSLPADPLFNQQFSFSAPDTVLAGINVERAWELSTGSGVVVAVIDTGILKTHEAFRGQLLPGYDFIKILATARDGNGRDADASDPGDYAAAGECNGASARSSSWHGSHVAGVIGAAKNGLGITGIAYGAKILPVRVLGPCGGFFSDIIDGIRWAAGMRVPGVVHNPNPAKVINLSLGGEGGCSRAVQSALDDVYYAGVLVVTSAGNDSSDAGGYLPGNCNHVLNVAAVDQYGFLTGYSNYGSSIDVSTIGGDRTSDSGILSSVDASPTTPSGISAYQYYQGTSQAVSHVSGIAALIYSKKPDLSVSQVTRVIKNSARAFPPASGLSSHDCTKEKCGSGLVDAAAAMDNIPEIGEGHDKDLRYEEGSGGGSFSWVLLLLIVPLLLRRR